MAVTHPVAVRNTLADTVVDQLDQGTTNPQGQMVFQTSASADVATCPLSNPAFGAAAAGTATANPITDDTNATGGTTDRGVLHDRDETDIVNSSVGLIGSGEDVEISSVVIGATDTVQVCALTYTAAP